MHYWDDGTSYQGHWKNGKKHGTSYYIEHDQDDIHEQIKVKKGLWEKGKRTKWLNEISTDEIMNARKHYSSFLLKKDTLEDAIESLEK